MKKMNAYHGKFKLPDVKKMIRVMKITAFFLLIALVQVSAETYSQAVKLNLNYRNVKLSELLDNIEKSSDYRFFYDSRAVDLSGTVSVNSQDSNLKEVLDQILGPDLTYEMVNNNIVVIKNIKVGKGEVSVSQQQSHHVSGRVTDASGSPLPGVTVVIKTKTTGTVTNPDGKYALANVPGDATLVFSFVGMKTTEISVAGKSVVDVMLEEETFGIEEVVAVGYGTMRKSDITGSVSSIKSDDILKSRSTSFLGGIQGQLAGVRINSSSGEPGASSTITIRGANSVHGSSNPLFVIDGMPIELNTDEMAGATIGDAQRYDPLSEINPSDIESVEILKDASATAIYGSRGANGVVIVTTKSGGGVQLKLDYDGYVGISMQNKRFPVLSPEEYVDYRWQVAPNTSLFYKDTNHDGIFDDNDERIGDPLSVYTGHDWQKEILRTAISHNHSLSARGGTNKTQYAGSIGYLSDQGIVESNAYERYNGRLNVNHRQSEKLTLGVTLNISYSELSGATQSGGGTGIHNGIVQNIIQSRPIELYDPNWDLESKYVSPLAMIEDAYKVTSFTSNSLNSSLSYKLSKALTFQTSVGGRLTNSKGKEFYGSETPWGNRYNGKAVIQGKDSWSWFNTNQITYNKKINKDQTLTVLGAFESFKYNFERSKIENTEFSDESTGVFDLGKGINPTSLESERTSNMRLSYFGRVNYGLKNRYLLTATYRIDGSSKFGTGNRFASFPSLAFAWRVSEESFLKEHDFFNNLKLRLSYGETGNESIPPYRYYARLGNEYYNGELGIAPQSFENPDLKWESTSQYNVGFDMAILNGRIELSADYYDKETRDMLLPVLISSQSGFKEQWQNAGSLKNEGVELMLHTRNLKSRNFVWSSTISFSSNKNTVTDLGDVDFLPVVIGGGFLSNVGRVIEGQPIGTAYGYLWDGVYQIDDFTWQNNSDSEIPHEQRTYSVKDGTVRVKDVPNVRPGSIKFKDLNDDGIVDSDNDRTVISRSDPKHFGGITNNLRYKNLELNFLFEWSYGNQIFNESRSRLESLTAISTWTNISKEFWDNRWTTENQTNKYPAFGPSNTTYQLVSSYYVEDGSWLRLKNLSISYKLPRRLLSNTGLSDIQVYFVGNNLMTWTKYSGFDPELHSQNALLPGFDRTSYPRARSYKFGVTISF